MVILYLIVLILHTKESSNPVDQVLTGVSLFFKVARSFQKVDGRANCAGGGAGVDVLVSNFTLKKFNTRHKVGHVERSRRKSSVASF